LLERRDQPGANGIVGIAIRGVRSLITENESEPRLGSHCVELARSVVRTDRRHRYEKRLRGEGRKDQDQYP
jgi:hypothetical protein